LFQDVTDSSPSLHRIGRDVLIYLPAKVIPAATGIFGIAVYTRLLGPKEYGMYALTEATVSLVYGVVFGWVGYVVWRYFGKYRNEQNLTPFLSTVATAVTVLFFMVAPLWHLSALFLSSYFDFEARLLSLLKLGLLVLGARVAYSATLTVLQVSGQSSKYALYSSVHALGSLFLAVGLIYFLSWGAEGILWATVIFMGGVFGVELGQLYKSWPMSPRYFSRGLFCKLVAFGLPQIGISLGALVLSVFDRYVIEVFRGPEEVGIYSAGYIVAEMSIQIPLSILMLATLPVIVQTFENQGEEETRGLFKRLFALYLILFVPAVFGVAALSQPIVEVLLGQPFHPAAPILTWVAAGVLCFGFSQYSNIPFQLKERPDLLLYLIVASGALNAILNLVLVPPLGMLGAAYATFVAYSLYCIFSYAISDKVFRLLFPWQTLGKSISASLGMYLILDLGIVHVTSKVLMLLMNIALGALVYLTLLIILKEQSLRDLRILKKV
jgi:O-antigen/teichoic acid export membrane protein